MSSNEIKKRVGKIVSKMKASGDRVDHPPFIKMYIGAGKASAAPPLGSQLGQAFNEKTAHYKEGLPIPTKISIKPDRSFMIHTMNPHLSYLIMQAAGINRGPMHPRWEIGGIITLKHVYEIAQLKKDDHIYKLMSMRDLCKEVIRMARKTGIKVVPSITAEELNIFMAERQEVIDRQLKEIQDNRTAKMLRSTS